MSPGPAAVPSWLHRVFPDAVSCGDAAAGTCRAVVVINDHSAAVVPLLRRALELRASRPALPVVVLTVIAGNHSGIEALVWGLTGPDRARALSPEQALAAIAAETLPVHVAVHPHAISFEYEA